MLWLTRSSLKHVCNLFEDFALVEFPSCFIGAGPGEVLFHQFLCGVGGRV